MTRRATPCWKALMLVAGLLAAPSAALAADQEQPEDTAGIQELLLLGPLEPIRLRLTIEIDSVPFRTVWRDAFQRMFDQFDQDHDGRLTPEQANQFAAVFQRGASSTANSKPSSGAMMNASGYSRDELRRRLEQSAPALTLRQRLSSGGAGPALVPLLDTDGDGRLSREELLTAEQSLHCRDFNDDQLITEQELLAGPSLASGNQPGESAALEGSVILLHESMDAAKVAEILLARYDRDRDGRLSLQSPAEILAGEGGLSALDADGDQFLNRTELRGFLELPRDVQLPLNLGGGMARQRATAAPRFRLQRKLDGGHRLHLGTSEINFRRNNRDPAKDDSQPRFSMFDGDKNDYLDANEFGNVPDRPEYAVVDRDSDGKIIASEFDAFFLQRARVGAVQLVLEVTDQGSDLFTTLDRNFDRVLTPRELHFAPALLTTEDRDGDGYLGGVEMSYNLTLELSRGGPRAVQNQLAAMRGSTEPQVKVERQGPAWFQKMDRNRDGDVSLSEFLGARKKFRELDKDADGLLSPDEVPQ